MKTVFLVILTAWSALLPAESALGPGKLTWMVNVHALKLMKDQGPEAARWVEAYFNNPKTYVMANAAQLAQVPDHSVPTVTFSSYASFKKTVDAGQLDPRFKAVIYDSEDWNFIPTAEKLDPGKYYALFSTLAHARQLQFLATPATNLGALRRKVSRDKYDQFVKAGIASAVAGSADVYEIQAQQAVGNDGKFLRFVSDVAAQARTAHPDVILLAGLSTNPNGRRVSLTQLQQAVLASSKMVDGYWLNIPGKSPYCPHCGKPQPGLAVDLLRSLAGENLK